MKIGNVVNVIDELIIGEITKIEGAVVTILTEEGFEMEFSPSELVIMPSSADSSHKTPGNMAGIVSEKEERKPRKTSRKRPKERNLPAMEVDLHIQKLSKNYKRMSNYDMLTLQLDMAKKQLEFAIRKRIQKVVFIHGVGEGVLKIELERLFREYPKIKFYEADHRKYGEGATEVYIMQSDRAKD